MKTETEIERKFIIRMPDLQTLAAMPDYTESDIVQTYLEAPAGVTHRIRKRTRRGKSVYTETLKVRIDSMSCRETEGEIAEERYLALLKEQKAGTRTLTKTRYTCSYQNHTLEIDRYPEWTKTCILEAELESREEEILFPSWISFVREVTGNQAYSNASMAAKMPCEDNI